MSYDLTYVQPLVVAVAEGATTPVPAAPFGAGAILFSSTTGRLMEWSGSAWNSIASLPSSAGAAGTILTKNSANPFDASWIAPNFPYANPALNLNGTFTINQRGYATNTALAANAFGHDRWKGGAAGCTYTFTQGNADTVITITAGSILQVFEPVDCFGTVIIVTWTGGAAGRGYNLGASSLPAYSQGTAATVGGVSLNMLVVSNLTPGVSFVIEFQAGASTGTLGLVKAEPSYGIGPTPYYRLSMADQLAQVSRFFRRIGGANGYVFGTGVATTTTQVRFAVVGMKEKRIAPTATLTGTTPTLVVNGGTTNANVAVSALALLVSSPDGATINLTTSTIALGGTYNVVASNATTFIDLNADL